MCIQNRHRKVDTYRPGWYEPEREMSLPEWARVLDQLQSFRPWISITGGEPLLYQEFQGFVSEAKGRQLPVDLTTNGLLLEKHARFIAKSGVEIVYVSLDGPEPVHDRIRGLDGAFRRSLSGLRALVKARETVGGGGPIIVVNCTMTRSNLQVLDRMVPVAAEAGADLLQFIHAMFDTPENVARHNAVLSPDWARGQDIDLLAPSKPQGEFYESEITEAEIPALRAALTRARARAKNAVNLKVLPHLGPGLLKPYYLDLNFPFARGCRALWTLCIILPDGTVSPCHHVIAGSVRETPLMDIWNGRTMSRYREAVVKGLFPSCARCCRRGFTPEWGASPEVPPPAVAERASGERP
jgi:MoaA/NifB/PqqE/SkfB family radical SAM enzyme